jgi:hypothetical protein
MAPKASSTKSAPPDTTATPGVPADVVAPSHEQEPSGESAASSPAAPSVEAPASEPAAAPASTTAVAVIEPEKPKTLVAGGLDFSAIAADAKAADQHFAKDDIVIPWLKIAQALSPEVRKTEAKYIPGLVEGDLFDTLMSTIFRNGDGQPEALVIPVLVTRDYAEFWPRDSKEGTGFIASHGTNKAVLDGTRKDEKNHDITEKGTEIVSSFLYYLLVLDPATGRGRAMAMSLSRMQMKYARKWNSLIDALVVVNPDNPAQTVTPPPYYEVYRLTTGTDRKDQNTWAGLRVEMHGPTLEMPNGSALYAQARGLVELIKGGKVATEKPTDEAGGGVKEDADLPF